MGSFPAWCLGKEVEFDCVGSWTSSFNLLCSVLRHLAPKQMWIDQRTQEVHIYICGLSCKIAELSFTFRPTRFRSHAGGGGGGRGLRRSDRIGRWWMFGNFRQVRGGWADLTHLSLASLFWDLGKQWWPRTRRLIRASLFAYRKFYYK